jgi:hypothetical protein
MQTLAPRRKHRATATRGLGWLAASGTLALALIGPGVGHVLATGGIVVDGNRSEWNKAATWVADLQKDGDEGPVEASLYLQLDCDSGTLFAMVETATGVTIQDGALQQVDSSLTASHFALSADGRGWEASYPFSSTSGVFVWSSIVTVFDTHFPYEGAPGTAQAAKGSFRFAVQCAVETTDPTPTATSTGQVGAATGKPRVTPPTTSTGPVDSGSTDDSASRLLLVGFGVMIAGILLLVPGDVRRNARRR